MSKHSKKQLLTPAILRQALAGSFQKLNPRYLMKNPVMFVVEVGVAVTLVLSIFPEILGEAVEGQRLYNSIVCVILFVTVLFANFAESVAEGRGKAQAASLKKDAEGHRRPRTAAERRNQDRFVQRIEKRRHCAGQSQ